MQHHLGITHTGLSEKGSATIFFNLLKSQVHSSSGIFPPAPFNIGLFSFLFVVHLTNSDMIILLGSTEGKREVLALMLEQSFVVSQLLFQVLDKHLPNFSLFLSD